VRAQSGAREGVPHIRPKFMTDGVEALEHREVGRLVGGTVIEGGGSLNANAVHLMRSQLTRSGAIYTRISSVTLK